MKSAQAFFDEKLSQLNPSQRQAVLFNEGHLPNKSAIVLAAAGSGKTTTLTMRILNLILNEKLDKNSIMALTFTNKAANEMRERLAQYAQITPREVKNMWVGTFHSMCTRILRDIMGMTFSIIDENAQKAKISATIKAYILNNPEKFGLPEKMSLNTVKKWVGFTDVSSYFTQAINVLKENTYRSENTKLAHSVGWSDEATDSNVFNGTFSSSMLFFKWSDGYKRKKDKEAVEKVKIRQRDHTVSLYDVQTKEFNFTFMSDSEMETLFLAVYQQYQNDCFNDEIMDFAELQLAVYEILSDQECCESIAGFFSEVLVDEFQDTNGIQYKIISFLTSVNKNLFVVGDDDQSIYAFRGARPENIKKVLSDFNATIIKIEENYRSTAHILHAANNVIAQNKDRQGKNLVPTKEKGHKIVFTPYENQFIEGRAIAREIQKLYAMESSKNQNYHYGNFAILYRTNFQALAIEQAMIKSGIPYVIHGGIKFVDREEIKHAFALFKLINNPNDDMSIMRLLTAQVGEYTKGFGEKTITSVMTISNTSGLHIVPFCMMSYLLMNKKAQCKDLNKNMSDVDIDNVLQEFNGLLFVKETISTADKIDKIMSKVTSKLVKTAIFEIGKHFVNLFSVRKTIVQVSSNTLPNAVLPLPLKHGSDRHHLQAELFNSNPNWLHCLIKAALYDGGVIDFYSEQRRKAIEIGDDDLEKEMNERLDNLMELISAVQHFAKEMDMLYPFIIQEVAVQKLKEYSLKFINDLMLGDENNDENSPNSEKVQLMTIHSSKGLEFDCVWIAGFSEELLPYFKKRKGEKETIFTKKRDERQLEEERRLAYVAITRAKRRLNLTHANERNNEPYSPSRFLSEIGQEHLYANLNNMTGVFS